MSNQGTADKNKQLILNAIKEIEEKGFVAVTVKTIMRRLNHFGEPRCESCVQQRLKELTESGKLKNLGKKNHAYEWESVEND
jgi:hypothetical protein